MLTSPHVTIVVLNWNQKDDTLSCLTSLGHTNHGSYDVVVVDNGSTDESVFAIEERFTQVAVLAQASNRGCAGGRNVGARHVLAAGAPYILFLDNDTEVAPDFLTKMVEVAQMDDTIGIVGPTICYCNDRQRIWTAGARVDYRTGRTHPLRHNRPLSDSCAAVYTVDFVAGCALLAKRAVFERVGWFDEDYFIYFEETDWCVRASRAGFRAVVVRDALVWHKESRSLGGPASPRKVYYMTRNQLLFASKLYPGLRSAPIVARLMLSEFRTLAAQNLLHRNSEGPKTRTARLRAMADFLRRRFGPVRGI